MMLFKKTAYDCRQATLLSIKKEEGRISISERVKLSYHLLRCDPCRRFNEQSARVSELAANMKDAVSDQSPHVLSEKARERMLRALGQVNS
jgi:hypothetical protein